MIELVNIVSMDKQVRALNEMKLPFLKQKIQMMTLSDPQVWDDLLLKQMPKRFGLAAGLLCIGLIADLPWIGEVSNRMLMIRGLMVLGALLAMWISQYCTKLIFAEMLIFSVIMVQISAAAYLGSLEQQYVAYTSEIYQTLVFVLIFLPIRSIIYFALICVVGILWFGCLPFILPFNESLSELWRQIAGYVTYSIMLIIGNQTFLKYRITEIHRRRKLEFKAKKYLEQATHDALTGLYNYGYFEKMLPKWVDKSIDQKMPLYLCLIDLDEFKQLNDQYGHMAGNVVLKHVSEAINRSIRHGDSAFRLGGDEFAVVLFNVDEEMAERVAIRIRREISQPVVFEGNTLPAVKCSIGLAGCKLANTTPDSLLKAADTLLYQAKADKDKIGQIKLG